MNILILLLNFCMFDLEIWSFEESYSIFFILYLNLWRIHILRKTRSQAIPADLTIFKDRRWRSCWLSNVCIITGFKTLPVGLNLIKLPFSIVWNFINFVNWSFTLSFGITQMWVIFSLTFIKLIVFHLLSSFYQIGIWWYERRAGHLRFYRMVSFGLGHWFLFDVNDILIHF